ncbi:MAG: hypothetical protein O3C67_09895, partial [Cyanobacteria bacterium]|nr:hypothetical protein [Cyanobacteriota bacterium]
MTSPTIHASAIQPLPPYTVAPLLAPAMQRQVKTLVQQIHAALERHQLAPEVEAEIAQLLADLDISHQPAVLLDWVQAALDTDSLDPEAQAQLQALLETTQAQQTVRSLRVQIHQALARQALPRSVQRELSNLLTLLPAVAQTPEVLPEYELAIAALVNPDAKRSRRHLQFARHLRRELAIKLRQNRNPLTSLFWRASGTPHHRLLSGLTWFLVLFAGVPAGLSALFFTSGVRYQYLEINQLREDIQTYETDLATLKARQGFWETQVGSARSLLTTLDLTTLTTGEERSLQQQQDLLQALDTQLAAQQEALAVLQAEIMTTASPSLPPLASSTPTAATGGGEAPTDQTAATLAQLADLADQQQQAIALVAELTTLNDALATDLATQTSTLQDGITRLETAFSPPAVTAVPNAQGANPPPGLPGEGDPGQGASHDPAAMGRLTTGDLSISPEDWQRFWQRQVLILLEGILRGIDSIDVPLILAVVSAGALGSFVSVIVRANDFIEGQQRTRLDLFLVGFFRPVVGMAFAVFLMAALESGMVSGILATDASKPAQKIYFYIAISFVAGFSERLVKDLMG